MHFLMFFVFLVFSGGGGIWDSGEEGGGVKSPQEIDGNNTAWWPWLSEVRSREIS